jgi:hypothetical protein
MGEDIDSPACQEVVDHLKLCPTCKVYFDTVKKTVTLCRDLDDEKKIPVEVTDRLYKVLNLDNVRESKK